jgi:hypothetical protein
MLLEAFDAAPHSRGMVGAGQVSGRCQRSQGHRKCKLGSTAMLPFGGRAAKPGTALHAQGSVANRRRAPDRQKGREVPDGC